MHKEIPEPQGPDNEQELIDLVKHGDSDAFDALLDMYMPVIRAGAWRFASAYGMDAEDFMQEAMIALFKAARNYNNKTGTQFRTYANVCIQNSAKSALKRQMKHSQNASGIQLEDLDKAGLYETIQGDPLSKPVEDIFLDGEVSRIRAHTIETLLSDFERRVLRLYLKGDSYHQISCTLGHSTKAVDNALQRVRRKLRSTV
ncbi:sigma-70 family RNA polymerase sigma factor [Ruminococcaceae bacterium OttesenSCG-928-L11]|nr:sigma-70 family RNA polymerase sigma factor [Ruminococcaceae bacterium OttesenSCG-928-L11]